MFGEVKVLENGATTTVYPSTGAEDSSYIVGDSECRFVFAEDASQLEKLQAHRADLPGVEEKDLDVAVHNGVLTVSGSRQAEERKEGESYVLYERQYGSFSRSFALKLYVLPAFAFGRLLPRRLSIEIMGRATRRLYG